MDMEFLKGMMELLTDEQLDLVDSAAWKEKRKRMEKRVLDGHYEPVAAAERSVYQTNHAQAIMDYKNRTGCSIMFAKLVMEREAEFEK